MQENGRYAIYRLTESLRMADFWGINVQPLLIQQGDAASLSHCGSGGWVGNTTQPVFGYNQNDLTDTSILPACIDGAYYQANTDIIVVRHVDDPLIDDSGVADLGKIAEDNLYLYTGLFTGVLFQADEEGALDSFLTETVTEAEPLHVYPVRAFAYYIRDFSRTEGDGIPTLVRLAFDGTDMVEEPLVDYVENMQIRYGSDTNGSGSVDMYLSADDIALADWGQVHSIKVELIVRAPTIDDDYDDSIAGTYSIGDINIDTTDNFRRRVFSTTIFIRNDAQKNTI